MSKSLLSIPVVYEDEDILVVDKPAGLPAHPAKKPGASVASWTASRVRDNDPDRPGIVHRLDRDTSGLMVIAKHPDSKVYMQKLFKDRQVQKTYLAVVHGHPQPSEAIVKLPIGRKPANPAMRAVVSGGRPAETYYRVIEEYPAAALLEIKPKTGRTHQIRVHLAHLGHPICGDTVYGRGAEPARQFLHASGLEFTAPNGRALALNSPLPPDLENFLKKLKNPV